MMDKMFAVLDDMPELAELALELFSDFPSRIVEIEQAAQTGEFKRASELAHSLKGATGNLGLEPVMHAAFAAERQADRSNAAALLQAIRSLKDCQSYIAACREAVTKRYATP